MALLNRAIVECHRVAIYFPRAVAIVAVACLALPLVLVGRLFWAMVWMYCFIAVILSGRRTLFQYEEKHDGHP